MSEQLDSKLYVRHVPVTKWPKFSPFQSDNSRSLGITWAVPEILWGCSWDSLWVRSRRIWIRKKVDMQSKQLGRRANDRLAIVASLIVTGEVTGVDDDVNDGKPDRHMTSKRLKTSRIADPAQARQGRWQPPPPKRKC
jgi:hypothetical protein